MFSEHSFCESPFASFIAIEINGEIFFFDLSVESNIVLELSLSRSLNFELETELVEYDEIIL
jgi:hypothetical protein